MIHTRISPDERISPRYWTGREQQILFKWYPAGGLIACLPLLPRRSPQAIRQQASVLHIPGPSNHATGQTTAKAAGLAWARAWRERTRAEFDAIEAAGGFALEEQL